MDSGYFLSPDPIGLLGGMQNSLYVPNPLEWIDPLGLAKCESAKKAADNISSWLPKDKHMLSSTAKRAAKFTTDNMDEVRPIIQQALRSENLQFLPNSAGGIKGVVDMGRVIGTKGQTGLRVIFDEADNIWTAFPVHMK